MTRKSSYSKAKDMPSVQPSPGRGTIPSPVWEGDTFGGGVPSDPVWGYPLIQALWVVLRCIIRRARCEQQTGVKALPCCNLRDAGGNNSISPQAMVRPQFFTNSRVKICIRDFKMWSLSRTSPKTISSKNRNLNLILNH